MSPPAQHPAAISSWLSTAVPPLPTTFFFPMPIPLMVVPPPAPERTSNAWEDAAATYSIIQDIVGFCLGCVLGAIMFWLSYRLVFGRARIFFNLRG